MFDFVRKHNRMLQVVLFLLIVPSFVLFGLEGYSQMTERGEPVAKVDGQAITQTQWDAEHKAEVDRLRAQMPTLDVKLLDSPQARYATLERMVRDRVFDAAAAKGHLTASDQRLARELQSNEVIASLRGPDGKIDMDRYKQLVGAQGLTPQAFEEQVRRDIGSRQVLAGVAATGLNSPAAAGVALGAFYGRREIQLAKFDAADYAARVQPTDAELEAFHKENARLFTAPEQASVEYVVLDQETVRKSVTVSEADLRAYYEQNAQRLAGQEERRASHILIGVPKGASSADKDKARARAQELADAARKAPATFGELARKNSQDPVSAANGGDLEWSRRGGFAAKPLEDAVFALKKGEVAAQPVETEFGFHVVQLTDVRAPQQKSFEQLKPELEAEVRRQQAQRKFAETAEAFSNAVDEATDSYKAVAERFKLEIRTAAGILREPLPGATGPLANPKLLAALFTPDSLEKKRNTEAVDTGANQLVSARIVTYSPARTLPLAEVRDQVRVRLVAQRAADLAKKDGQEKLAAWKADPSKAQLGAPQVVSREETARLPQAVVEAALRADPSALPALTGVDVGLGGYAVVRVVKELPRPAGDAARGKQELAQYTRLYTSAEALAYYDLLKQRYKVKILAPKPAADSAQVAALR